MPQSICLNLPTKDVQRAQDFMSSLGFRIESRFSSETSSCVIISENILVMFLQENVFKTFTPKEIVDAKKANEMLISLGCGSREEVDELVAKAIAAGGTTIEDATDYGFMYSHGFVDPDGHMWGLNYMVPNAEIPRTQ